MENGINAVVPVAARVPPGLKERAALQRAAAQLGIGWSRYGSWAWPRATSPA